MKITIIAVGKLKEKFLKDGCTEYIKRISPYARVNIVEIPEERCPDNPTSGEIAKVIEKEGQRIADKIPKSSAVFALCIEGTQLSSEDFAQKIQSTVNTGVSEITFVIGGSFGLSPQIKNISNFKLSFGKMTLPHQLMRLVLTEQVYRAFSILNNSKYHK